MTVTLKNVEVDEISILSRNWRPAVPSARIKLIKKEGAMPASSFDQCVQDIRKRDSCSRTDALIKARKEHPDLWDRYRDHTVLKSDNFEQLVAAEMRKGWPTRAIAGQRVIQKFGALSDATRIEKNAGSVVDFMRAVDAEMIEKRISRTAAMVVVRKRHPALYASFQEV